MLDQVEPDQLKLQIVVGRSNGRHRFIEGKIQAKSFVGDYRREVLPGVGHFIPRERPEAIIAVLADGS